MDEGEGQQKRTRTLRRRVKDFIDCTTHTIRRHSTQLCKLIDILMKLFVLIIIPHGTMDNDRVHITHYGTAYNHMCVWNAECMASANSAHLQCCDDDSSVCVLFIQWPANQDHQIVGIDAISCFDSSHAVDISDAMTARCQLHTHTHLPNIEKL